MKSQTLRKRPAARRTNSLPTTKLPNNLEENSWMHSTPGAEAGQITTRRRTIQNVQEVQNSEGAGRQGRQCARARGQQGKNNSVAMTWNPSGRFELHTTAEKLGSSSYHHTLSNIETMRMTPALSISSASLRRAVMVHYSSLRSTATLV